VRILFPCGISVRCGCTIGAPRLVADGHGVRIPANGATASIASGSETLMAEISASQWIWMDARPNAWTDLASVVTIWLDYLRFLDLIRRHPSADARVRWSTSAPGA
jgi:hypothetical protein